jgi:5-methylcytosine-specific restriction endonuclease McrA
MPYRDPEKRRAAAREATRRWYQRNKELIRAAKRQKDRAHYAANRDSLRSASRGRYASDAHYANTTRARNRAWYARNREQRRAYKLRYRQEHGDELRARERERDRRRYAENPRAALDYYKQWRLRNLERARNYVRVSGNKRRAATAGEHFTLEEWEALLVEHTGHCAYCGSTERIDADHRMPLYRGGSNLIANILPACRHCNRRKHRRTEEEFRALLQSERRARLVAD